MTGLSPLSRKLIRDGFSRATVTGPEPLNDAAQAMSAAVTALDAARALEPGAQQAQRLADCVLWIDQAKHHLTVERIRAGADR